MDVNRTFGVEIELSASVDRSSVASLLNAGLQTIGQQARTRGYSHQVDQNQTNTWYVETDASVHSASAEHPHTMEVKTPVLKGVEGLKALKIATSILSTVGHVNKSCGLHVHHYLHPNERNQHLRNVVNAWIENEKFFMECLPQSRQSNSYCRKWSVSSPSFIGRLQSPTQWFRDEFGISCRKRTLNIQSVDLRGTVEFRLHSGTYEFEKISNWLIATQRFLIKAMRGDFIFQKASTFDEFLGHMETDFDPDSLQIHIDTIPAPTSSSSTTNRLSMALVHPEAKKKRLPRPGTKAHLIATMLLKGATKENIVDALDSQFGSIGKAKQNKFVSGQLTNMKNPKYSWGFRIQKSRSTGKFRIVPHDGQDVQEHTDVPDLPETRPEALRIASKLDLRSLGWLKGRREYFFTQQQAQRRQGMSRRQRSSLDEVERALFGGE